MLIDVVMLHSSIARGAPSAPNFFHIIGGKIDKLCS